MSQRPLFGRLIRMAKYDRPPWGEFAGLHELQNWHAGRPSVNLLGKVRGDGRGHTTCNKGFVAMQLRLRASALKVASQETGGLQRTRWLSRPVSRVPSNARDEAGTCGIFAPDLIAMMTFARWRATASCSAVTSTGCSPDWTECIDQFVRLTPLLTTGILLPR